MKKERVWVYRQNDTYGVFHNVKRSYVPNEVYPLFRVDMKDDDFYSEKGYIDLAVSSYFNEPKVVYLDGVETGVDYEQSGDRWIGPFKDDIYIFEDREEYEIYKDALLSRGITSRCIVLSDFEKKEEIEEDLEDVEFDIELEEFLEEYGFELTQIDFGFALFENVDEDFDIIVDLKDKTFDSSIMPDYIKQGIEELGYTAYNDEEPLGNLGQSDD